MASRDQWGRLVPPRDGDSLVNRRDLLQGLVGAGMVGTAGCLSSLDDGEEPTGDEGDTADGDSNETDDGDNDREYAEGELDGTMPEPVTTGPTVKSIDSHEVHEVWAGYSISFKLYTHGHHQFVAFYDDFRQMTVGQRQLGTEDWEFVKLDSFLPWDTHNYVTITTDAQDHIHVSGNMHSDDLVYFRSEEPLDITTLEPVESMIGDRERQVTYPEFMDGPDDKLIYEYRNGGSDDSEWLYNIYDPETDEWSRLLDQPVLNGLGEMGAYFWGPVRGPDGDYHLFWIWRQIQNINAHRDVSYAKSPDLKNWETAEGDPLELPITPETEGVVVDPVPPFGGLLNVNIALGFDTQDRVVLTYHKYDDIPEDPEAYWEEQTGQSSFEDVEEHTAHEGRLLPGDVQIYNARFESDGWEIYQTSDWNHRWEFGGGGILNSRDVGVQPVEVDDLGRLTQRFGHAKQRNGTWILDESSLKPKATEQQRPDRPANPLGGVSDITDASKYDGRARVNWRETAGGSCREALTHHIRWEALDNTFDGSRNDWPDATPLRVFTSIDSSAVELELDVPDQIDRSEDDAIVIRILSDVAIDIESLEFGSEAAIWQCEGARAFAYQDRQIAFHLDETGFEAGQETAVLMGQAPNEIPVYARVDIEIV